MGTCIICGTSTDGPICEVHAEDVVFEFEGNKPSQLTSGRFYVGSVDGYAEFGVFVNIGTVTGLLHRSKLDRRLESLDWEVGDEVCVRVNNVRDNGDIDLDWSIRESPEDFRGQLVQTAEGDRLPDDEADDDSKAEPEPESTAPTTPETPTVDSTPGEPGTTGDADEQTGGTPSDAELAELAGESSPAGATDDVGTDEDEIADDAPVVELERVPVEALEDNVGDPIRLEGIVDSVRQTSGPTVFELRDETGIVDCAAFVEPGVRAYPEIDADDVVRLDGEVRVRRGEIQVETESAAVLEGEARETIETRMEEVLEDRATPASVEPIADDPEIEAITDDIETVATQIRRAVLQSRPIVVRHDATADGYVAGAAIERAVLPLIESEHGTADSVYHYFDRRPLENGVYDMNDATKDVTRMLDDRDRHDEKIPLFVFAAAASTAASTDGLELLEIYDAPCIVLDGRSVDEAVAKRIDSLVTVDDRTASTVAATLGAAINDSVRDDLLHLPAVSYWVDAPEMYDDLAALAGLDADETTQLREAIELEAYYQSYEDKRELVIDLLFEKRTGLAAQVSEQFETKLDAELDTVIPNLEERVVDGVTVSVLDTDAFTHRYDFPPTRLLMDELSRRLDSAAVIGVGTDELHIRVDDGLDLDAIVSELAATVPEAGIADPGAREPTVEFLAGERDAVVEAAIAAVASAVATTASV